MQITVLEADYENFSLANAEKKSIEINDWRYQNIVSDFKQITEKVAKAATNANDPSSYIAIIYPDTLFTQTYPRKTAKTVWDSEEELNTALEVYIAQAICENISNQKDYLIDDIREVLDAMKADGTIKIQKVQLKK